MFLCWKMASNLPYVEILSWGFNSLRLGHGRAKGTGWNFSPQPETSQTSTNDSESSLFMVLNHKKIWDLQKTVSLESEKSEFNVQTIIVRSNKKNNFFGWNKIPYFLNNLVKFHLHSFGMFLKGWCKSVWLDLVVIPSRCNPGPHGVHYAQPSWIN